MIKYYLNLIKSLKFDDNYKSKEDNISNKKKKKKKKHQMKIIMKKIK